MGEFIIKLRKFGLNYCDLPTMLSNVSILLRVLTLNIDSNYEKGIPLCYYILTIVTWMFYFFVYLFDVLWFVLWRCTLPDDMIAATIILSLGIASEIGTVKLMNMFLQLDKFKKITQDYLKCDAEVVPGSRFHTNLMEKLKIVKKRALMFWSVVIGNGFLYTFSPLLKPGRHLPEDIFILYGLEPVFESPNYEISYLISVISIFFPIYGPANCTTYLIIIVGYTEAYMIALSKELTNVWPDAVKQAKEVNIDCENFEVIHRKLINKYVKKALKKIVVRHNRMTTLFTEIKNMYTTVIIVVYILLYLALTTELLGQLENTYLQIPYTLAQVAMDCYTGQKVADAGDIFEKAVYESKWENFDKDNMKTIQILLTNSQKALALSAGGLVDMSFMSLMNILKSIFSAYTTLRSTVN